MPVKSGSPARRAYPAPLALRVVAFVFVALGLIYNAAFVIRRFGPEEAFNSLRAWAASLIVSAKVDQTIDVFNDTLGFEKVIALGHPDQHPDKRDVLSLMASLTGFRLTWVAVGDGDDDSAAESDTSRLRRRRNHVNAIRRVVEDGLSSALIIVADEDDDVDWDTHLKPQLALFARAARALQQQQQKVQARQDEDRDQGTPLLPTAAPMTQPHVPGDSPYGRDWDLLWLGASCGGAPQLFDARGRGRWPEAEAEAESDVEADVEVVILHDDPTAATRNNNNGAFSSSSSSSSSSSGGDPRRRDGSAVPVPEHARVVYHVSPAAAAMSCTPAAYALSLPGARKALQHYLASDVEDGQHRRRRQQTRTKTWLLDDDLQRTVAGAGAGAGMSVGDLCRDEHLGMRCVGVAPGLFGRHHHHHRQSRGRVLWDSEDVAETDGDGEEGEEEEAGFTENIMYSTRLNLRNLVQGRAPRKQWED